MYLLLGSTKNSPIIDTQNISHVVISKFIWYLLGSPYHNDLQIHILF